MDCSPPGFSVHGISQARILEWVAISFSRESSWPRDRTHISCLAGRFFNIAPWEALTWHYWSFGEVSKPGSPGSLWTTVRSSDEGHHLRMSPGQAFCLQPSVWWMCVEQFGRRVRTRCKETISIPGGWSEPRERSCSWREGGLTSTSGLMGCRWVKDVVMERSEEWHLYC